MEPFYIFFLIISLSGQPVGVYTYTGAAFSTESKQFPDKVTCEAAITEAVTTVQHLLDTSDNPAVRGQFAVADGRCATDKEMGLEPEKAKPSNLRGE